MQERPEGDRERKFSPATCWWSGDADANASGEEHAKVTGFVGGTATKPTTISEKKGKNILHKIRRPLEKKPRRRFCSRWAKRVRQGRPVRIHGKVEDVTTTRTSCGCR